LAFIKNVMSGTIIDPDRLVIGTEEGLFCLDLDRSGELSKLSKNQDDFLYALNFYIIGKYHLSS